jgi:hypothetical protein
METTLITPVILITLVTLISLVTLIVLPFWKWQYTILIQIV